MGNIYEKWSTVVFHFATFAMETLLDQFEQKSHEYDLLEKDTFYQ